MATNKGVYLTQKGFNFVTEDSLESFVSSFEYKDGSFVFSDVCYRDGQEIILGHYYELDNPKALRFHKKGNLCCTVVEHFNDDKIDDLVEALTKNIDLEEDTDFLKDLMRGYKVTLDRLECFITKVRNKQQYKLMYVSLLEREKC
jgi:hypothetical protein